jgi:lipoprotein NlpD
VRWGRGLAAAALAGLCACATEPRVAPRPATQPHPAAHPAGEPPPVHDGAGVVHVVRPGQTLYRIARTYGVEPDVLMQTNGISDPRGLAVGQELFVPGATRVLEVKVLEADEARPAPEASPARPAPEPPSVGGATASPPPLAWPLKGVLYGRFGMRGGARHDGIDIAAPQGTPVMAAADGTVLFVGEQNGYGKVVILRHEQGLVTVYAHNSEVLVREGARVARGQVVSRVGQTGRTTGPHLHFEVRDGVRPRNPLLYLP